MTERQRQERRINPATWDWLREALDSGRVGNGVTITLDGDKMRVEYLEPPFTDHPSSSDMTGET
jgi:hypothetical protein